MKKNSKLVKRIERCLSAIFCISALFACFTSTYAWFTASRAVQASAVEFTANEGPLPFSKIEIFNQSDEAGKVNPYRFSTTASGTYTVSQKNGQNTIDYVAADTSDSTKDDLAKYDNLMVGYTQCILYLFTVNENIGKQDLDNIFIQIKRADTSNCLFLPDPDSNNLYPKHPLSANKEENALSNIISFRALPLTSSLESGNSTYYQFETSEVESDKVNSFKFVTNLNPQGFLEDTAGYASSDNLFKPATETYTVSNSSPSLKQVAVIVSYDDDLINNLFTINLGNSVLDNDDSIGFKSDWSFVI